MGLCRYRIEGGVNRLGNNIKENNNGSRKKQVDIDVP